ncbi:hypothetical protein VNO77_00513 [Canavalia gladiata]|uniref:Uncharacterized protein n=1 Tax=Canavalia gladiata TaxID=3824 RepID=A0AAN9R5D4_CANGL
MALDIYKATPTISQILSPCPFQPCKLSTNEDIINQSHFSDIQRDHESMTQSGTEMETHKLDSDSFTAITNGATNRVKTQLPFRILGNGQFANKS